ncbi:MAG: formate dehydrogenase subunit alpha [Streptococcaceae bacterium]|jgi:formate dehydrogenase major subunit|nr:formate dehydrogenase subunit alpha [Streptococcaceae bacterium]
MAKSKIGQTTLVDEFPNIKFTFRQASGISESGARARGLSEDRDNPVKTQITFTMDDQEITVDKGTTILEASKQAGIDIPTLCYLKEMTPDGSCRMCMVEVEGGRKGGLVTACTEPAREGMVVHTRNEKIDDSRRFVIDLLLSNQTRIQEEVEEGDNELLDYAREYGVLETSFKSGIQLSDVQARPIDDSNPFFTYDPSLCIMCRRCSRVCQHLQERDVISTAKRGFETVMLPCYGENWDVSQCEYCGLCVSVCPTGALKAKDTAKFHVNEFTKVRTTCPHCGTGCQMDLLVKDNQIIGVEPANGAANKNQLCVKGYFGSYKFIGHKARLTKPLIKRNGIFEEASWDEALDLVASKFNAIKEKYGPDALAGSSCSRSINEDNYVFQKMVRAAFGTNNVDNCARVCHSSTVHGLAMSFGSGAMTNTIADITTDVNAILLVGSNTTEAHPVIGAQIRQAVRNGAKLIVIDPRKIDLVDRATLHLQAKAGSDVALVNAMMNVIISEGLEDKDFIAKRTEGYEEMRELVKDYTPEKVAEICGVSAEQIREAARIYAKAEKAPLIYCLGVTEHSTGVNGVMSMANLAMLVGKVGKPGCGVNPLRGQNNVQGASDMGDSPFDFPGYQHVADPKTIEKFEKAWNVTLNPKVGQTSTQFIPEGRKGGKIHGMYIFGEDPVVTDPDLGEIREGLEGVDFLVVQELFMTETAAYADVVLPGRAYAEKDGTFTNTERRVQLVRRAVQAPGEAREDFEVFCDVATRMGYPMHYDSASEILDEIAAVTPTMGGMSFARLEEKGSLQWPCRSAEDEGTPIMHVGQFTRENGLGLFHALPYYPAAEEPDEDYPVLLSTGRMLYHYNTRAMTGKTEGVQEIAGHSYIELNHENAAIWGIETGDKVRVSSRRGTIETYAVVNDAVLKDASFMTFHFPDGNANELTNAALDPISFIPEYKVCAVKIEKIESAKPREEFTSESDVMYV